MQNTQNQAAAKRAANLVSREIGLAWNPQRDGPEPGYRWPEGSRSITLTTYGPHFMVQYGDGPCERLFPAENLEPEAPGAAERAAVEIVHRFRRRRVT
jgi:hypothetical protein